jgi:hypothetical protein
MPTPTVYEKPTSTICRKPRGLRVEHGVDFEPIGYRLGTRDSEITEPHPVMGLAAE